MVQGRFIVVLLGLALQTSTVWASSSFMYGTQGSANGGPHALTTITGSQSSTFTYDRNGDMAVETIGVQTIQYTYTVGRKLKQVTNAATQETTKFFYTVSGEKVAVRTQDSANGSSKTHVYAESFLRFTDNAPRFSYGSDAEVGEDGELNFFVKDHLGSVVATLSKTGVVERRDTLPYGEAWFAAPQTEQDRGFNGNLMEAGHLIDYGARHYNPRIGKFIEADNVIPDVDAVSFNRYAYVGNNPVNFIDPTGHRRNSIIWEKSSMPRDLPFDEALQSLNIKLTNDDFVEHRMDKTLQVDHIYIRQAGSKDWTYVTSNPMLFSVVVDEGRKQVEGDQLTPTGKYLLGEVYEGEFTESQMSNYPTAADRAAGRTGSDIALHGERGKTLEATAAIEWKRYQAKHPKGGRYTLKDFIRTQLRNPFWGDEVPARGDNGTDGCPEFAWRRHQEGYMDTVKESGVDESAGHVTIDFQDHQPLPKLQ